MDTEITTVLQYKGCDIKVKIDVITITHRNGYNRKFTIERKHKYAFIRNQDNYLLPLKFDKYKNPYEIATALIDFIKATTKILD